MSSANQLTPAQIRMIASSDLTNKVIAERLGITVRTVQRRRAEILKGEGK
jgi:FixJ family two-component response regulator